MTRTSPARPSASGTSPPPAQAADPVRTIVVWLPDWPITALGSPAASAPPIAIMHANTVVACSPAARAEGVRRGQRRRDAQARCPSLRVVPVDTGRDGRAFLPVVDRIEKLAPGVQILRPGLAALRARGPARYYGGEEAAARTLIADLDLGGVADSRIGIADGPFTAERAARSTRRPGDVRGIDPGASADFLSTLSVATLDDDELVGLLARLGVRTLGEFAALDPQRVSDRFGARGVQLHALAGGRDSRPVTARTPPPELARQVAFEPPLELADQVAFGVRQMCDDVVAALGDAGLVCTELRVELTDEFGGRSERVWLHPTFFGAAEMVDRVRWQLEAAMTQNTGPNGSPDSAGPSAAARPPSPAASPHGEPSEEPDIGTSVLSSAVAHVRVVPESVDDAVHHAPGLFGQGPGERVHHALSRVQAMLGHRGVVVPAVGGGRFLADRQVLVPWGDRRPASVALRDRPWPGSLPDPLPATVFAVPVEVAVVDAEGSAVTVDERGRLSAAPAMMTGRGIRTEITAWAGPWTIREREWDAARHRVAHRFQLVDEAQGAWLVVLEDDRGWIEGRYD